MILKGSQRTGAADLATHLLNAFDNETVELADIRGTVAGDLHGALAEYEATAAGTHCQEPFYSLSLNPPFAIDRAAYFAAIDRIEQRLKLEGQPRAVVFHVKDGREHCHVVWSRIYADGDQLRAVHMSHDHSKLSALSCEFFRELGVPLPFGLEAWEARQPERFLREGQDYTRAEKVQSDATGITVAERRAAITEAYRGSDSAETFRAALEAAGYTLAIGDKRAFVVLDQNAEIFSLARQIEGATTRDVKAKLAGLAGGVPDVQKAKGILSARAQARVDRARDSAKAAADTQRRDLEKHQRHRALLAHLDRARVRLRDAEERLAIKIKHKAELDQLAASRDRRVRKALSKLPGLSAIIRHFQHRTDWGILERQRQEREVLRRRQELCMLRQDRSDRYRQKVENREYRALAIRAMALEMRRATVEHQRYFADRMPVDNFMNPNNLGPQQWYQHHLKDAEHLRSVRRAACQWAREQDENEADIGLPKPRIGTISTRAADFIAAVKNDDRQSPRATPSETAPPQSASSEKPKPPSGKNLKT